MSRKYHKLVVVQSKTNPERLHRIQQGLLSVVNPSLVASELNGKLGSPSYRYQNNQEQRNALVQNYAHRPQAAAAASDGTFGAPKATKATRLQQKGHLIPGYVIVADQTLIVDCNIGDELVLRRLMENPKFQLAWYKNGKRIGGNKLQRANFSPSNGANQSPAGYSSSSMRPSNGTRTPTRSPAYLSQPARVGSSASGRFQWANANGRRLIISPAQYTDAGDYLCSWSELQVSCCVFHRRTILVWLQLLITKWL